MCILHAYFLFAVVVRYFFVTDFVDFDVECFLLVQSKDNPWHLRVSEGILGYWMSWDKGDIMGKGKNFLGYGIHYR